MKGNTEPSLTCAQEEHLIAPICSCNLVHCNRGELIVDVGPDHQGALVDWVYHIMHGWVVSHEVDNLVWVIFGGFHVWGESTTRTLIEKRKWPKLQFWHFASSTLNLFNLQCQVEGRGSSQCMPPTDSWAPPCEQKGRWRPCGCQPWSRHTLLSL